MVAIPNYVFCYLLSNIIIINVMWPLHYATQCLIMDTVWMFYVPIYHMIEMNTFCHLLKTCCIVDFLFRLTTLILMREKQKTA